MPERPPAPQLSDYPHHMTDNIRFADLDVQNHVNNVAIATFFESGRVGFSRDPVHGFSVPGAGIALRRIEIDYLAEMTVSRAGDDRDEGQAARHHIARARSCAVCRRHLHRDGGVDDRADGSEHPPAAAVSGRCRGEAKGGAGD